MVNSICQAQSFGAKRSLPLSRLAFLLCEYQSAMKQKSNRNYYETIDWIEFTFEKDAQHIL